MQTRWFPWNILCGRSTWNSLWTIPSVKLETILQPLRDFHKWLVVWPAKRYPQKYPAPLLRLHISRTSVPWRWKMTSWSRWLTRGQKPHKNPCGRLRPLCYNHSLHAPRLRPYKRTTYHIHPFFRCDKVVFRWGRCLAIIAEGLQSPSWSSDQYPQLVDSGKRRGRCGQRMLAFAPFSCISREMLSILQNEVRAVLT